MKAKLKNVCKFLLASTGLDSSRKHSPSGLQTSVLVRCFTFCSFQMTINQFLDFKKSSLPVNYVRNGGMCLRSETV